jgi:hypothetical protein
MSKKNKNETKSFKSTMLSYFKSKIKDKSSIDVVPAKRKEIPNIIKMPPVVAHDSQEVAPKKAIVSNIRSPQRKKDNKYQNILEGLNNLREKVSGLVIPAKTTTHNHFTKNLYPSTKIKENIKHLHGRTEHKNTRTLKVVPKLIHITRPQTSSPHIDITRPQTSSPHTESSDHSRDTTQKQDKTVNNNNVTKVFSTNTLSDPVHNTIQKTKYETKIHPLIKSQTVIENNSNSEKTELVRPVISRNDKKETVPQNNTKIFNNTKKSLVHSILKNNKIIKTFSPSKATNDAKIPTEKSLPTLTNISNSVINEVKNVMQSGRKIRIPALAAGGLVSKPTVAQIGDSISPSGQPDPEIVTPMSKVPEMLAKTKTLEKSNTIINKTPTNKSIGSAAKQTMNENANLKLNKEDDKGGGDKPPVTVVNNSSTKTEAKPAPTPQTKPSKSSPAISSYAHLPRWRRGIG